MFPCVCVFLFFFFFFFFFVVVFFFFFFFFFFFVFLGGGGVVLFCFVAQALEILAYQLVLGVHRQKYPCC